MAGVRPKDWHVLDLDRDPTPGDPDRVRSLAKNLQDFADDVGDALRLIKGMADEEAVLQWAGKSAKAFQDQFSGVPKQLKKLKTSYDMAGGALAAYWPKLERAQALADRALADGRAAQSDLSSAKSRLSSADTWVTKAGKEADKYKDDPTGSKSAEKPDEAKVRAATRDAQHAKSAQTSAQSDVSSAQDALDAAKKMAADARKMREDAAGEAKRKIDEASDAGIRNRKWWEEVGDWFSDNWDTIVTVCKVVVAVVGIIALVIGGPILGAIVLIAALVVLADTLNKYSKGQASLWDVAFAALDCIPGMKGLTTLGGLAKGLKGGAAALKGLRGGLKGMGLAARGLGRNARGSIADGAKGAYNRLKSKVKGCGDPVDAATGQMFLEETDGTLPAALPLAFTRRAQSGYRTGWWFGPTWASTVDQRLEVDGQGLVLVTEDGLLLEYPHPQEPGAHVLPKGGPRWPLTRLDTGGYRVDDPVTGRNREFSPPRAGLALLERVADRNGNTVDFDYDADGTPLAIRHSGGYQLKLTVLDGRVTSLSVAGGGEDGSDLTLKRYGYTDGSLTSVVNSSGVPMEFTYDERLRVSSWRDSNGSRYDYGYDDQDRCVSQGGEEGYVTNTFSYDIADPAWPGCRVTEVTSAEGDTSRFVVDENCLVVAEIDPLGGTVRTAYDSKHHLIASTDQLGHTTNVLNNELGQPVEISRPDGSIIRVTYNHLNLATAIQLPDGTSWTYAYDARGNCTAITNPAGETERSTFTPAGHPAAITDSLGHTTTVRCDAAGLPVRVTDPLEGVVSWQRDTLGRPVTFTDAAGHTTRFAWSPEGRLVGRTAPHGESEAWTYDGEGNCVSHSDQLGQVSRFEYTHFDLLAARTGPDGARYEFAYDASLRVTQVTNPLGLVWSYGYDAAGRLVSETDFDRRAVTYTHDATGRLTSRTNALGESVSFDRDMLGRTVRKDVAGVVTTFAHDSAGRLIRAAGPDISLTLERDRLGRLLSETVDGRTLAFGYDEAGRRTRRTTPAGATSVRTHDAVGQLARLVTSGHAIDFERAPSGRETARRFGADVTLAHVFDELGRRTAQSVTRADGRSVQRRAYTYRADGNLIGVDEQFSGARHFDLDTAGRVTAVHARAWTETYAYDAAGNQTHADWPSTHPGHESTGPRVYAGTDLTRAGQFRYERDALGRVTVRQKTRLSRKPDTWRYTWDAEDRLTDVITPDGTHWRYLYDPLGRRSAKQRLDVDGETVREETVFSWDGTTLCEQTTVAEELPGPVTLTWDHQGLHPVAQTERVSAADASQEEIDSRFFSIVTDLVGTPTELVDESGAIAWRSRSTLWGTTAWTADSRTYTPLRFPGQYFDPESGLHYNYFRHYDPETGRYLTADPLGLAPAPNPSTYVPNPHTWSDHLGLAPDECTQSIFKAPGRNQGEAQELNGYRADDFPGDPDGPDYVYPNGRVYFAKERSVADKYAKAYGEGVVEIKIPKSEYAEKYQKYERNYEGGPDKELEIPNNVVEDLNQYPRVRHK
ncbi:RHS repeat-associated core domain-containing protein [Streptomyces sp. NPDC088747]|uniref:RHS repeat-associated core domain-containing protein n=1 Tax=Streptomyces sp. NPDC088747 TaxID=3365886 RepID=UPI0038196F4F